jgi:6,7-dimethyl-8-ribityllumazine synthase
MNYEGNLLAKGMKIAIVAARFNEFITSKLVSGALDCIKRHGGDVDSTAIYWVPGSFEIPLISQKAAESKRFDAIICLGAVIRGDTPHFDYVSAEMAKGISKVALDSGVPCAFGVLTTDSIEQAIDRAGAKAGNKGWEATLTAIETVNLIRSSEL